MLKLSQNSFSVNAIGDKTPFYQGFLLQESIYGRFTNLNHILRIQFYYYVAKVSFNFMVAVYLIYGV